MTKKISKNIFQQVFIVGYGDIGRRVAKLSDSKTTAVSGLARSLASAEQMKLDDIIPVQADLDSLDSLSNLNLANSLLFYFAPPPATGTIDTRMSNLLNSLDDSKLPSKIIYISTSGVYGDQAGCRVTEDTRTSPGADRSRRRLNAEQQLTQYVEKRAIDLIILRVSAIYGPGRLPEKRIREGVPVLHEELAPKTNRIHADDLARICIAAAEHGLNGEIYNISDGCDSNMTRYFFQIADYLGLPRPPSVGWQEAEAALSKGMLSYLRESRQMDNSKMLKQLKIQLKYPDLSTGLAQMKHPSAAKRDTAAKPVPQD
ncbi:MAG: NAD-dependent epimerase/dehydratase family protein [Pseudomonadota bacterium]|nr:NAD-dependent epimerase/dehydratase family protein [Pseudomonadota bacterium]